MNSELYIAYIGGRVSPDIQSTFLRETAELFGGFTLTSSIGGWINPQTSVYSEEPVLRIELLTTRPYATIVDWAREACELFNQDAILIVRLGTRGSELVEKSRQHQVTKAA
jgi:hypothetical protein